MHVEHNSSDDLNTVEIKKIVEVEASIEVRLSKAREEANKIIAQAREDADEAVKEAQEEAALVKTKEIENCRLDEIEKSKVLIREAEKTASQISSIDTVKTSKRLFEEFQKLIGA